MTGDGVLRIRAEGVTWADVEGEVVGLDLQAQTYFSANGTGTALWPLLVRGATRAELTDELVARFEVDRAQAATDVDAYVASLGELGLLDH